MAMSSFWQGELSPGGCGGAAVFLHNLAKADFLFSGEIEKMKEDYFSFLDVSSTGYRHILPLQNIAK